MYAKRNHSNCNCFFSLLFVDNDGVWMKEKEDSWMEREICDWDGNWIGWMDKGFRN